VKEQYPDLDIRFVFSNSRTRISKQSDTTYGKWCEQKGFRYADRNIPTAWLEEAPNVASLAAIAALQKARRNDNDTHTRRCVRTSVPVRARSRRQQNFGSASKVFRSGAAGKGESYCCYLATMVLDLLLRRQLTYPASRFVPGCVRVGAEERLGHEHAERWRSVPLRR
jgi:hypothetical protein